VVKGNGSGWLRWLFKQGGVIYALGDFLDLGPYLVRDTV
jgi:hypothetical protein